MPGRGNDYDDDDDLANVGGDILGVGPTYGTRPDDPTSNLGPLPHDMLEEMGVELAEDEDDHHDDKQHHQSARRHKRKDGKCLADPALVPWTWLDDACLYKLCSKCLCRTNPFGSRHSPSPTLLFCSHQTMLLLLLVGAAIQLMMRILIQQSVIGFLLVHWCLMTTTPSA